MRYSLTSTIVACMLLAPQVGADVEVVGDVEYGVFTSQYQDFQPGERVLSRTAQPIERTDVVPAKLGTKFGMRYNLQGKTSEGSPLTLLYLTPGVVTPEGKRHDKFVVVQKLAVGAPEDVMAFQFTEHYEIVPGEWQFMVFQEDRKLLEQRFTVR